MKRILFIILFFFLSIPITNVYAQKKNDTLEVLKVLMDDLNPLKALKLTQKDIAGLSKVVPPYYVKNITDTFSKKIIDAIDKDVLKHYGLSEMITKEKLTQTTPINIEKYLQSQYNVISSSLLPSDSLFLEELKKNFSFTTLTTPVFIKNFCFILIQSTSFSQVMLFKKEKRKWQKVPYSVKWHLPSGGNN